jgi:membrane protein implicated in regulation of membrane protease activity
MHWLVTGCLLSGAMWAVLIAIVTAAFGNWTAAGYLVAVAVVLLGLLWLGNRNRRPRTGRAVPPSEPS